MTLRILLCSIILFALNLPIMSQDVTVAEKITSDNIADIQVQNIVGRGWILDFAWSAESDMLAVASDTGLWLYDPLNLGQSYEQLDSRSLNTVAFSNDGKYLVAGGQTSATQDGCNIFGDDILIVWDFATKELLLEFTASIAKVMFFPNQNLLLAVNSLSGLELWDIDARERLAYSQYIVPSGASHSFGRDIVLSISPDGEYFSAISHYLRDAEPFIWSTQSTIETNQITPDTVQSDISVSDDWLTETNLSPDESLLANFVPNQLTVWNAETLEELSTLLAYNGSARSLALHPQGTELALYHYSGLIRIRDMEDTEFQRVIQPEQQYGSGLLYSPDGQMLVSGTLNFERKIYIWNALTGEQLATYELEHAHYTVTPVLFSSDSRYLYVTSSGESSSPGNLVIIDLISEEIVSDIQTNGILGDIGISPDGSTLAIDIRERDTSGDRSSLQIWDLSEIDTENRVLNSWEFDSALDNIDFVTATSVIFERQVNTCVNIVSWFDLETGIETPLDSVEVNQLDATSLHSPTLNADRKLLAVATQTGIRFWNTTTMQELEPISATNTVYIAFSHNGDSFLSVHGATLGGEIRLWRIPSNQN